MKPSLIYRDLQYANIGIDIDNDRPLVFDTCCFFTHNECKFSYEALAVAHAKKDEFG
jgi:fructosamine-3-kinase